MTGLEGPGPGHVDGNTAGTSWERLNERLISTAIPVSGLEDSHGSLGNPDSDDTINESDLWQLIEVEMVP